MSIELLEQSETTLAFHVVCRYADMYRESGFSDYGMILSCNRDFAMIQGFNAQIKLSRTQTIMEGYLVAIFTSPSGEYENRRRCSENIVEISSLFTQVRRTSDRKKSKRS